MIIQTQDFCPIEQGPCQYNHSKIVAVYDNGGKTIDQYTIVIAGEQMALGVSKDPTHYMGFSQWGEVVVGGHLGKKIKFEDLPEDVRIHVVARLREDI